MRFVLPPPRQSRSLVARVGATIFALVCLGALIMFSVVALAILVVAGIAGLIWFRWHVYKLRKRMADPDANADTAEHGDPDVIEGEYVVVDEQRDRVP